MNEEEEQEKQTAEEFIMQQQRFGLHRWRRRYSATIEAMESSGIVDFINWIQQPVHSNAQTDREQSIFY